MCPDYELTHCYFVVSVAGFSVGRQILQAKTHIINIHGNYMTFVRKKILATQVLRLLHNKEMKITVFFIQTCQ
jgi:hypothetical protein